MKLVITRLNREKRTINDSKLKEEESIQSFDDRCAHLNKLKARLERQLDEVEDSWEREKKHKGDIEKLKRQVRLFFFLFSLSFFLTLARALKYIESRNGLKE